MAWGLEKVQSLGPLLGTWAYTGPLLGLVGGSITRGQGTAEAQETAICLSLTRANEIIQRLDNAKNEIVTIVEHGSTDASGTERFSESGFTAWRQKLLTALNEAESFERSVPPLAGNQAGQPKEKPSSPQPTEPATTTQPPPAKTPWAIEASEPDSRLTRLVAMQSGNVQTPARPRYRGLSMYGIGNSKIVSKSVIELKWSSN